MPNKLVKLTRDHLDRMARCRPERAIEELIWNGLDAGGPSVRVMFELNELGAVNAVEVHDLGSGIRFDDLERAFGAVGKSIKIDRKQNEEGRAFHGSEGFGRYRALSICAHATWVTTYQQNGRLYSYTITMNSSTQESFDYTEPVEVSRRATGTTVRLESIRRGQNSLLTEPAHEYITERLALYLLRYSVTVEYNGAAIDAHGRVSNMREYPIGNDANVVVVDWNFDIRERRLLICDSKGFSWHELPLGVPTQGLSLTAFLHCPAAREWDSAGRFLVELDNEIAGFVEKARARVHEHVVAQLASRASDVVAAWKNDKIYPYSEDEPQTLMSKTERQVFDIVASQVHIHHAPFRNSHKTIKRLTLGLMRQAIESNPSSLRRILEEVLTLSREQQDDLARLFDSTNLSGMIAAANDVTLRLKAIEGFDEIIHGGDWKKTLRERTQLHRLLVRHLWIFGDEYSLDTDDETLRHVLSKHLKHLGRDRVEMAPSQDVTLIDGSEGIPDLMLSRKFARDRKHLEHLVIELKRPSVRIGAAEITQIKSYAAAVGKDERFSRDAVTWRFILIGNDFDELAEDDARGSDPYGRLLSVDNRSVWILRWSDVLHDARARYNFFKDRLELEVSRNDGVRYLQEHYRALMEGKGLTKKQERAREGNLERGPNALA